VFANNGHGDGYSHNMYISNCDTFTLRHCYSHHARIGHEVKSRAKVNRILYNRIMNGAEGTASYEIDLPNGGTSFIIGNVIQQGPHTDNATIVSYGAEGLSNPGKDLYVVNNTIVNDRHAGTFVRVASGADNAQIVNNLFIGPGTAVAGPSDRAGNLSGNDGDVVDRVGYDYHLVEGSAAIDGGTDPGVATGFDLAPAWEYTDTAARTARAADGAIDIGAYEYGTGSSVGLRPRGTPGRPVAGNRFGLAVVLFGPRPCAPVVRRGRRGYALSGARMGGIPWGSPGRVASEQNRRGPGRQGRE
jgi:hypothetical protein